MSTILVLAPVIAGSWPVYASLVTGVALSMGYNLVQNQKALGASEDCHAGAAQELVEEVSIESTNRIAATMKDGDSLSFAGPKYELTFVRDPRGSCKCLVKCARGVSATKAELKREAQKLINGVTRAYVYDKLKTELTRKGYTIITDDASAADGIKLTVRKWK